MSGTKPPLDGSPFHDRSRFQSSEIARAFASAIRGDSPGLQSEVTAPEELSLGAEVALPGLRIVRGGD